MPLYQTGGYQVKPSAVNKVKQAIKEFVAYVQANEPGIHMYLAWQQKDDPRSFFAPFHFQGRRRANSSWPVRSCETLRINLFSGTGWRRSHFYRLRDDRRQAVTRGAGYEFFE